MTDRLRLDDHTDDSLDLLYAELDELRQRAEQAEAALKRVRRIHTRGRITGACNDCGQPWPCEVTRALDQPGPAGTGPAEHLGGRANAEDCPACSTTDNPPPYPWICPGPAGTAATEESIT